jgi:hypothetical protein
MCARILDADVGAALRPGSSADRFAARAWTNAVPPLMRPDHVHFRWPGGQALAARLQADLDAAMSE